MATLTSNLEEAFKKVIADDLAALTNPPALNLYTGKDNSEKVLPCVIIAADGDGSEDPPDTGNFNCKVIISVKGLAVHDPNLTDAEQTDPKANDLSAVDAVFGILMDDGLQPALNATAYAITVFPRGISFDSPTCGRDQAGVWVDEMTLHLYCCGSKLEP
jgi:hypothetical protein